MRQEARAVLGNQTAIFTDADSGRTVTHDPAADHGITVLLAQGIMKPGQYLKLLTNIRSISIGHGGMQYLTAFSDQFDICAFARK